MRITCPNCQATYEVGESDIPEEGIEVECSACLKRWMQLPVEPEPAEPEVAETDPSMADVIAAEAESTSEQRDALLEIDEPDPAVEMVVTDFPGAPSQPESSPEIDAELDEGLPGAAEIKDFVVPEDPSIDEPDALAAPTSHWRVPKPPKEDFSGEDPLDLILAEVSASSRPSSVEASADAVEVENDEVEDSIVEAVEAPADIGELSGEVDEIGPDVGETMVEAGESFAETEEALAETEAAPVEAPEIADEVEELQVEAEATADDLKDATEEEGETASEAEEPSLDEGDLVAELDESSTAMEETNAKAEVKPVDVDRPEESDSNDEAPIFEVEESFPEPADAALAAEASDPPPEPEVLGADEATFDPAPEADAESTFSASSAPEMGSAEEETAKADMDAAPSGPDAPFGFEPEDGYFPSGPSTGQDLPDISEPSWPEIDVPEPVATEEDKAPFSAEADAIFDDEPADSGESTGEPEAALPDPGPSAPEKTEEDAHREMNDLIRNLGSGAASGATAPHAENAKTPAGPDATAEASEDDEVFHPWDGEVAPSISEDDESAPDAAAQDGDEDDFEWDEPPSAPAGFNLEPGEPEEGSVEAAHMAALERQNAIDRRLDTPDITNVIQADIPQVPFSTMASSRTQPMRDTPRKPTPVDSQRNVEAAIREQLQTFKKPPVRPVVEPEPAKTSLFGRKPKPEPTPAPAPATPAPKAASVNPLKDALLASDDDLASKPSGKRSGFLLVMILFLLLLALYIWGGQLAEQVPTLAPYIESYTGAVDNMRAATQKLLADYLPART